MISSRVMDAHSAKDRDRSGRATNVPAAGLVTRPFRTPRAICAATVPHDRVPVGVPAATSAAPVARQPHAQVGVVDQIEDGVGDVAAAHLVEQAVLAVAQQPGRIRVAVRHHRHAAGHQLERQRRRVPRSRGDKPHIHAAVQLAHLGVGHDAEIANHARQRVVGRIPLAAGGRRCRRRRAAAA